MSKTGKNIYQRNDGRWEGRFPIGKSNEQLRYKSVYGRTYEEVDQKLEDLKHSVIVIDATDENIEPLDTFQIFSSLWLHSIKSEIKPSSAFKYTHLLNSYLLPCFGEQPIESITRNSVISFSRELYQSGGAKSQGLSAKTVNGILSVMKNVLDYASQERDYTVADLRKIAIKESKEPLRILSRKEQRRLTKYLCEHLTPCHLGILLSLYTGLRIGEICGLKWKDIHLEEGYLHVRRTVQRLPNQHVSRSCKTLQNHWNKTASRHHRKRKTSVVAVKPKSDSSNRKIPLQQEILQILQAEQRPDDAYLLTAVVDIHMEPRTMENHFQKVVKACGIEGVRFHTLRHTFATRCVELEFDVKTLSEILGHSDVTITLNTYVHPSMNLKKRNMARLSALFADNADSEW